MPQLQQQSPTSNPNNLSPVYLDIENRSMMISNETSRTPPVPTTPTTMKFIDNFVEEKLIHHSNKGQMIDFNIFYENLLGNHHHHHNNHHQNLYSLNSSLFNESLNFCLNKVCNGKYHHHHNHNNNNSINNDNNKSFSIDSILGFGSPNGKDSNISLDDDLFGTKNLKLQNQLIGGNQSTLYSNHHNHHNHHHSIKKLSSPNEEHHIVFNKNELKNDKIKGFNNKKINGLNKKSMKMILNNNNNNHKSFGSTNTINGSSNGGGGGGISKSKRVRTIFTPEQLERLENEFEKQQYMVGTGRLYLASTLNLTEAQVKVWFQNRRIKWRKQHLEGYQDNMDTIKDKNNNSKEMIEV